VKVVILHNFYRSENASGENQAVRDEIDGLRRRGFEVELFSESSDRVLEQPALRRLAHAHRPLASGQSAARLERLLRRFRPDVALVENLYPLLSPALLRLLRAHRVPTVAAVRNYRLTCVAATHWREGAPCHECLPSRLNVPAVRHACYGSSVVRSIPMAAALAVHARAWHHVDHFLPISEHTAAYVRDLGIPADRITIRPDFVPDVGPSDGPGRGFVFAGRMSDEKGFGLLVDAWRASGLGRRTTLTVLGSGPLASLVADGQVEGVRYLGLQPREAVVTAMREAAVVVVPSMWHEPFGLVVMEGAAACRPAVVSDRGALPHLVVHGETGWVATPTVDAMAAALRSVTEEDAVTFGAAARRRYLDHFTEAASLDVLCGALTRVAGERAA